MEKRRDVVISPEVEPAEFTQVSHALSVVKRGEPTFPRWILAFPTPSALCDYGQRELVTLPSCLQPFVSVIPTSFLLSSYLGLELYLFFFPHPYWLPLLGVFLLQKSFLNSVTPIRKWGHLVHTWHCGKILPLIYSISPSLSADPDKLRGEAFKLSRWRHHFVRWCHVYVCLLS